MHMIHTTCAVYWYMIVIMRHTKVKKICTSTKMSIHCQLHVHLFTIFIIVSLQFHWIGIVCNSYHFKIHSMQYNMSKAKSSLRPVCYDITASYECIPCIPTLMLQYLQLSGILDLLLDQSSGLKLEIVM